MARPHTVLPLAICGALCLWMCAASPAPAKDPFFRQRAALQPFVGQEVLIIDTTSGVSQYRHDDALKTFRLRLHAVQRDYIIVSRNVEGDRRDFVYPLGFIRRIRTESDGVPLRPIVIELY